MNKTDFQFTVKATVAHTPEIDPKAIAHEFERRLSNAIPPNYDYRYAINTSVEGGINGGTLGGGAMSYGSITPGCDVRSGIPGNAGAPGERVTSMSKAFERGYGPQPAPTFLAQAAVADATAGLMRKMFDEMPGVKVHGDEGIISGRYAQIEGSAVDWEGVETIYVSTDGGVTRTVWKKGQPVKAEAQPLSLPEGWKLQVGDGCAELSGQGKGTVIDGNSGGTLGFVAGFLLDLHKHLTQPVQNAKQAETVATLLAEKNAIPGNIAKAFEQFGVAYEYRSDGHWAHFQDSYKLGPCDTDIELAVLAGQRMQRQDESCAPHNILEAFRAVDATYEHRNDGHVAYFKDGATLGPCANLLLLTVQAGRHFERQHIEKARASTTPWNPTGTPSLPRGWHIIKEKGLTFLLQKAGESPVTISPSTDKGSNRDVIYRFISDVFTAGDNVLSAIGVRQYDRLVEALKRIAKDEVSPQSMKTVATIALHDVGITV